MNILSVDIGGTAVKYALMDPEMRFLTHGSVPTANNREDLVELIGGLFDQSDDCGGIAISLPGIIDSEKGYIVMGGALRYNDGFYLRDALSARCPVPICMENDAKCAALAEAAAGSLRDVSNGIVLIFGTMIGGGIIIDHKLFRGNHFAAGEVSYIISDRSGIPSCEGVWGNRCGVPELCRLYAEKKGLDTKEVNGRVVFEALNAGDPAAAEALDQYSSQIAVQIFNLQTVFDPDRFAIGGGISAQPAFINSIRCHLKKLYAACPYFVHQAEVVACKFQNDANLYGAFQCFDSFTQIS